MYRQYKVIHDNIYKSSDTHMIDELGEMTLWTRIQSENEITLSSKDRKTKDVDRDLKTIRIFISSTFKDFYNERELLVKSVFPKLRRWCEEQGLFLVECDLRWGVPSDATSVEAVSFCFFIGLIGDRFGWVPSEESVIKELKEKYDWIENSSVTLMEIVHGVIRSGTPNSLFMLRSSESLTNIPDNHLHFFREDEEALISNVSEIKRFIQTNFADNDLSFGYRIKYDSTAVDPISGKERLIFTEFEEFAEKIEESLKKKISDFRTTFNISSTIQDNNDDMVHKSYLRSLDTTFKRDSYMNRIKETISEIRSANLDENPILIISGEAGIGKSTLMGNLITFLDNQTMGNVFYHFCGTSNSSHSLGNIGERFISYVSSTFSVALKKSENSGENLDLHELLNRREIPNVIVIIDALDETSDVDFEKHFPKFTSSNILLLLSVLKEHDPNSTYRKLTQTERNIKEMEIEEMEDTQLCSMVGSYLNNFGKRLDPSQMGALMSFSSSKNPLWLISACEELRIHGDYSTLKTVILSLPSNIVDLNRTIIQRLMRQDSTNVLKCFLKVMIVSKAGVWENVVRDLLASILGLQEPVSHSTWVDIARQLKGFLQIESIPLPLIKFRHRVMRQSMETELQLDNETQLALHGKMADFFERSSENENHPFLGDYVFHLIKSDARDRMISFMRSKKSWRLFPNYFSRSRVMMSMRCINPMDNVSQTQKEYLMMCMNCTFKSDISIYSPNRNCCSFCGSLATTSDRLSICVHHRNVSMKCALCGNFKAPNQGEYLKICQMCKSTGFQGNCSVVVRENDFLFRQQLGFSKAVYNIQNLI